MMYFEDHDAGIRMSSVRTVLALDFNSVKENGLCFSHSILGNLGVA